MKKSNKLALAILMLALTFSTALALAKDASFTARADETFITLAGGRHEKYIDRADLSTVPYARAFYDWLVESTDNDGVEDDLIEFTKEQYLIHTISDEFNVDASGDVGELAASTLSTISNANFEEVADWCSFVYASFNRDYNQVFWLKREIITLSSVSYTYDNTGKVTYTQEIKLLIKNEDPADSVGLYDCRLPYYADGTLDIKTEITAVNNAIEAIINGVDEEASNYEKVKYFNNWLTKNNCYALNTSSDYCRDIRGPLLGQNANSKYAPVCEGYARSFKVLCDRANIPCVLSSGSANGEDHMWNLVQMENGNWYAVDVTWNDPVSSGVYVKNSGLETEDYLLVSANTVVDGQTFKNSHLEINRLYDGGLHFENGPELTTAEYGAPVAVKEWDVSKTGESGAITATLYQKEEHTLLNPAYKLIISGNGEMKEFTSTTDCPWQAYAEYIEDIEIRSSITNVSGVAFKGLENLETVTIFGNTAFGNDVFYGGDTVFNCHKGYSCYDSLQLLGYTLNEICEVETWQIVTEQSCEEDEIREGECRCGEIYTKVGALAHGHDYSNWEIETEPTVEQGGVIKRTCSHNNAHQERFDIPSLNLEDYEYHITDSPECEEYGKAEYIYVKDGQEVAIEVDLEPIGHDFGAPTYEWNYLTKTCVATRTCYNNYLHVETENGVVSTDREVGCQTDGEVTFTATFTSDVFETQVETVTMTAKEHDYSEDITYDDDNHWYECNACLNRKDEEPHDLTDWETKKPATLISKGLEERSCECGYKEEREIDKVNFVDAVLSGKLSGDIKFILLVAGGFVGLMILIGIIKGITKKKR